MKWRNMLMMLSCLLPPMLRADMVTLQSNDTYYGSVVRMTADQLVLKACLPDQSLRELTLPRAKLLRIEFNEQQCNEGEPPQAFGSHASPAASDTKTETVSKDTLLLHSGESRICGKLVIDENSATCDKLVLDRSEKLVWRIELSGR